ncbi:nitroreductase family protein [bacterium]|nr:nitroreductase family protein [bacterium]
MDVFEAIRKRRSVRLFQNTSVPLEDLLKIVDAGRLAPSGSNLQRREFIIITDRATLFRLNEVQPVFDTGAAIGVIVDQTRWAVEDASAAVENILLAATALGYGSCWIEGTLIPREEEVKELLNIPKEKRLFALIPIGIPLTSGEQAPKRPLEEITHLNRYGNKLSLPSEG